MTMIEDITLRAKQSAALLRIASPDRRAEALKLMAEKLILAKNEVLKANAADLADAADMPASFRKRLKVDDKVFDYMTKRLKEAAALPDPVGKILDERLMPSGLAVRKVAVPIGVIAMIYEARPNVTTDAAAVAIKSGTAVILKGGSESLRTNLVLAQAMRSAAQEAGLPADTVQLIPTADRAAVAELLKQDKHIDLIIPRGGKSLINFNLNCFSCFFFYCKIHFFNLCHYKLFKAVSRSSA